MKQLNHYLEINRIRIFLLFLLSVSIKNSIYGQVNLQTASATFSLPMFNWQDDKSRLNTVVALSYSSGNGLKVNDIASNVGQGWSLIAGGVITRLQLGEPDDQEAFEGNGSEKDTRKYPDGMLYADVPSANGCPIALTKYPIYGYKNQLYSQHNIVAEDKQLDYFSFQFNGKAGLFVLDKNGNKGVSLGDSKMIITFQHDVTLVNLGIRTTITSFTIQDVDGLKYKFTKHGLTKVLKSEYCDEDQVEKLTQPEFENGGVYHQAGFENSSYYRPWVVGSWYLTEIEDVLTHRKVSINYTDVSTKNIAGEDISYNKSTDSKGNAKNYVVITHKTSVATTPEITTITYPDKHTVTFNYGNTRMDWEGRKVLSSVDVTYDGRSLSRYQLNTTYFILNRYGTPVSAYQKKVARLCLKSVQKFGVDLKEDTPPYVFDYYTGSNATDDFVPPPFFYAKDIWGFYNGNNSKNFNDSNIDLKKFIGELNFDELRGLCFLNSSSTGPILNAKQAYAKNGLLRQIIYPTGGTLTYEYEQNTGILGSVNAVVGGMHVARTSSTDGGYSNNCSTPITTQYNYVLEGTGNPSSLWGLEMPVNSITMNSHYEPEFKTYRWRPGAIFGECYFKFLYPGILAQSQVINLEGFKKFMEDAAPALGIISTVTTIVDVINLICISSGAFAWVAVILDAIVAIFTVTFTCFIQDLTRENTSIVYYNYDLNGISPLPAQFKRVEVVESTGGIGKTVHEFTSKDDYPLWEEFNPAFSAKQRFAPWAYGLPKLSTVYDVNGNKVKQTENIYNFNTLYNAKCDTNNTHYNRRLLLKRPLNLISSKCQVNQTTSQRNTYWSDPARYNDPGSYQKTSDDNMLVDIYDLYTGRAELNKTYERVFKLIDPSQYVETSTEFVYNDENYEVSLIKTMQSDGTYKQKNIYYTVDFLRIYDDCYQRTLSATNNVELIKLVQNNIIALPVETNEVILNGSNYNYTYDKATVFTTLANGDIKPLKVLEGRFNKPEYRNSPWPSDNNNFSYWFPSPLYDPGNPDYSFYKVSQAFTYDASGNLTGLKDEGSRLVHNIYDYNDKYIAASVINADPTLDKSAYSSFESFSLGGWSLTGSGPNYVNSAITGKRSFALASNTFSATLNTAKPYVLSFWATNSNVVVTGGATLVKSAPTYNGFTYYEYAIAQGTSSVSLSGNASIDELRLYPNSARMRTVTYDPLIGKTSENDENNRTTYYEYDNLGRMQFIKDETQNIVKMYEYNNISAARQNGCPTTYYNRLISETFTKSGCGTGYLGGNITYTVPANKYTSAISQEDADAKAESELFEKGQTAADATGSCILLYYNDLQSRTDTTESCEPGNVGGSVTYTVPANKYFSTISKAYANQKALTEIAANAYAYANSPEHAVCSITTAPDWIWLEGDSTYCLSVNGSLPPHQFVLMTDINPNSTTYNEKRWVDVGPQEACPAGTYYNDVQSGTFTKNNCTSGYTGGSVTYTVSPGKYSSTVSQAAADQQAIDEINANGQSYANSNGSCYTSCSFVMEYGFNYVTSGFSSSGSSVSFYIVFYTSDPSSVSWSNTNLLGTITGSCKPSSTRVLSMSENGRTWEVTIYPSGQLYIRLISGTAPSNTIGLSGGSYAL